MATETLNIKVHEPNNGSRKVAGGLRSLAAEAKSAGTSISALKKILKGTGLGSDLHLSGSLIYGGSGLYIF